MLQFVVVVIDDNGDDFGEIILKIATDAIRCVEDNNCLRLGESLLIGIIFDTFGLMIFHDLFGNSISRVGHPTTTKKFSVRQTTHANAHI